MKLLKIRIIYFLVIMVLLWGCNTNIDNRVIDRYPTDVGEYLYNARSNLNIDQILDMKHGEYDFCSIDLTNVDLLQKKDLSKSMFDSETIWPKNMPKEFSPKEIMENGKSIGLNIEYLHQQGITGNGINIAIIDSALLVDHEEYSKNIKMYKEFNIDKNRPIDMHGTMVTSIIAGKTMGVAPDAGIYYIADTNIGDDKKSNFVNYAKDINYIINLNKKMSSKEKIKIISISAGLSKETDGYDEFLLGVNNAKSAGIEVFWVTNEDEDMRQYIGAGKIESGNYNNTMDIRPAEYLKETVLTNKMAIYKNSLLIPCDQKTYASFTGKNSYVYQYQGGMSTVIPYVAGLYALALQVNPTISFNQLTNYAQELSIPIYDEKKEIIIGRLIDSKKLIEYIK